MEPPSFVQKFFNQRGFLPALTTAARNIRFAAAGAVLFFSTDPALAQSYSDYQRNIFAQVSAGNLSQVKAIVLQDENALDQRNQKNATPLMFAIQKHEYKIAQWLADRMSKAQINADAGNHRTALIYLVADSSLTYDEGKEDLTDSLIKKGAAIEFGEGTAPSALAVASLHNNATGVNKLIEAGAKVNSTNQAAETPLHYAAAGLCSQCVQSLLDAGANPNLKTKAGETAFSLAIKAKPNQIVGNSEDKEKILDLLDPKVVGQKIAEKKVEEERKNAETAELAQAIPLDSIQLEKTSCQAALLAFKKAATDVDYKQAVRFGCGQDREGRCEHVSPQYAVSNQSFPNGYSSIYSSQAGNIHGVYCRNNSVVLINRRIDLPLDTIISELSKKYGTPAEKKNGTVGSFVWAAYGMPVGIDGTIVRFSAPTQPYEVVILSPKANPKDTEIYYIAKSEISFLSQHQASVNAEAAKAAAAQEEQSKKEEEAKKRQLSSF